MRQAKRWAWGLLALTVVFAGCTRLRDEKTMSVDGHHAVGLMAISPQASAMKITVTATSSAGPVTLYLAPTADAETAMISIESGKESPKILFKSTQGASVTLTGDLPLNTDCTVIAFNDGEQKTEVKASVVGK